MSGLPGSQHVLKGSFQIYFSPGQPPNTLRFQYNPSSLQHAFLPQYGLLTELFPGAGTGRDPYAVKGQPAETITIEIEFDATDQLENPGQNATAVKSGVYPQIAALESTMRPVPPGTADSPYTVFELGAVLVVPVLLTSCTFSEEAFDTGLNPIRVKATVAMRILTTEDLPPGHPGRAVYEGYLQALEGLAGLAWTAAGTTLMSTGNGKTDEGIV